MLSKSLHAIPRSFLENIADYKPPKDRLQFIQLWNYLINDEDTLLTEILAEMFCEEGKIEFDEFLKCTKSYHNFLELWWSLRAQTLSMLMQQQPETEAKVEKWSQLGVINQNVLWNRALTKVSETVKSRINKIYHLSDNSPLSVAQILTDLNAAKNNESRIPL